MKLLQKLAVMPQSGTPLPVIGTALASTHIWDADSWLAVQAAACAERPLLLRGEPGVGKTQIAQAIAAQLGCPIVSYTCDVTTELTDLLWRYDAVARMGEAQLAAIRDRDDRRTIAEIRAELDVMHFVAPGPFWWGLSWDTASTQKLATPPAVPATWKAAGQPCVVLIDEVDKAEAEVPNGLLEVLTARRFRAPDNSLIEAKGPSPLVVFTSNEERNLPEAFLRRCVVHTITMPDDTNHSHRYGHGAEAVDVRNSMHEWLVPRVRAHVSSNEVADAVLDELISVFCEERQMARQTDRRPPGLAELLDLVRCFVELREQGHEHSNLLNRLRVMILSKPVPTWLQ